MKPTSPTQKNRRARALRWFSLPCFVAGSLALAGCQLAPLKAEQAAANGGAAAPAAPNRAPAPPSLPATNTNAVVDAANAFLATLSEAQRKTATVELTPANAARWSNFPSAVVRRNGLFLRDMNPAQVAAALAVARVALSEDGMARFQGVRAADNAFAVSDEAKRGPGGGGPVGNRGGGGNRDGGNRGGGFGRFGDESDGGGPNGGGPNGGGPNGGGPNGGGPNGGGPNGGGPNGGGPNGGGPNGGNFGGPGQLFGEGNYMIAFLGQPSKSAPWMLQIGGHHLAFNLTYRGAVGAATPYFVGVQPNIWKDADGVTHEPLAPMHNAMRDLVNSLSPAQLAQAKLKASFDDVYVGPGKDAQFPAKSEGVPVSQLAPTSRELVKKAIAAWTDDSVQSAAYRKLYFAELEQTKIAYSGSPTLDDTGDYVRIDGPHVWIEFACQASNHYHTIWRDRETDYGAEFTF